MRDTALAPGLSAGQWDFRGKIVMACGILALLLCVLVATGLTAPEKAGVGILGVVVCIAGLMVGGVMVWTGSRKTILELSRGYSTVNDVPGLALRHPRTGALIRAWDQPVEKLVTRRVYDGVSFPLVGPNHPDEFTRDEP
jgi:hypothetical protein